MPRVVGAQRMTTAHRLDRVPLGFWPRVLLRSPAAQRTRPGSEWWELVVHASLAAPERWAGPRHGAPERWDWGRTLRTLVDAIQRREHLDRVARNLTPEQQAALWSDPSPEAAELRRVARAC